MSSDSPHLQDETPVSILEIAGIRASAVRVLVLRCLMKSSRPISAVEIEEALETVDRSSITRTLSLFASHNVIHQISDGSGAMRYELCQDHKNEEHNDEHAHFHCKKCGVTYCINDIHISIPDLPTGFQAENISYVITGICPNCR